MSDIWHKAGFHEAIDDKLKVSKDGKWVYWTMYGWNIPGKDAHDIGCEWTYLDDLLALETELERTTTQLALYKDFADSAKRTLDGSNDMIKSWHKLLQSDYSTETKCHILNQAISAYVEEREKHALKGLGNE